jgi:twitching motility two-component system response regulator PilH
VLVTSKGMESDKFWGKKQGADEHIPKPFTPEQVTDVIRRFVG